MNIGATHPIRVVLFWDLEHARDTYCPYFTRVVKKTWTFTRMITHDELVRKILKHRGMDPNLWRMVFDEPSILYPEVEKDDDDNDDADKDYDVSNMGSEEQIDDLIESGTIRLLDWNDAMIDIQLGMRFVVKIQEHTNKHRNMTSKFISKLILHLVANDPEIPVSNVIQEVQVLLQTKYTLLCSHVFADNGTRPDAYMSDIYSMETYKRKSNFYPFGHEDFWRDAPYNLTFYPLHMNNQRDRKQGTRFQGK
ncbi:hypothetical protein M9H77_27795 [Catharanthus roseus]|uniref:Uncharacterized protein n=1 Tax=Catharanthus roseus TaxID=4058 RepID=A0ACC0AEY9_CATRO|nr:hypothetical protein M9H77_27795 [Catharanthus roseus]